MVCIERVTSSLCTIHNLNFNNLIFEISQILVSWGTSEAQRKVSRTRGTTFRGQTLSKNDNEVVYKIISNQIIVPTLFVHVLKM